ncbi:MAG: SDR family NAD(P)-dependent oxidoreductase [Candidatus Eremiobacteraeota bacterium]|nr:SDR family NAD(P)-dependent oxidoreductase [Candidatus Eremiobacteraeota bacterium]
MTKPSAPRVLIVTGASSGIGRALVVRAASRGFALVAVGRDGAALDRVVAQAREFGSDRIAVVADVRTTAAANTIVGAALERFGRIDVLVNAAGTAARGLLLEQSDAENLAQFETHVTGPLRLTRAALPSLERSRGQVFFFGSGVARVPVAGLGAYPAMKAAVRAMTMQLRRELRGLGVAITYVDPGAVATPFMRRAGMQGPPSSVAISADVVAEKLLRAIETRARTVNAAPLQTLAVALGEMFAPLTDIALARFPHLAGTAPRVTPSDPSVTLSLSKGSDDTSLRQGFDRAQPDIAQTDTTASDFDRALEPLARRMERVKLSREFVAELLVPGATLELGEVAMRWAGMPNKNERAAVAEVLDALATAGFVQKLADDRWTVLRAP